jgi:hypothetical protein
MRWAADILEKAGARYSTSMVDGWTPAQLRREAAVFEAEDREEPQRAALVGQLSMDILNTGAWYHGDARQLAKQLIAVGWRKETP